MGTSHMAWLHEDSAMIPSFSDENLFIMHTTQTHIVLNLTINTTISGADVIFIMLVNSKTAVDPKMDQRKSCIVTTCEANVSIHLTRMDGFISHKVSMPSHQKVTSFTYQSIL